MRKTSLLLVIILSVSFLTSCGKDNFNLKEENNFYDNVNKTYSIVKNLNYDKDTFRANYKVYLIQNNIIFGQFRNSKTGMYEYLINRDISDYNFTNGIIVENVIDNSYYVSVEGKDKCAVKEYDSSEIVVYDISEKEKCHLSYAKDNNLFIMITASKLESKDVYTYGTISNDSVKLTSLTSMFDTENCKYQWYRNGEKIPDSNVDTYYVVSDFEDADYYVEMTTYEGDVIESDIINVKIDKN